MTQQTWNPVGDLRGPKGEDSTVPGPRGPEGPEGRQGPMGPEGPRGPAGPEGKAGADGATGPRGPIGLTGAEGQRGPIGLTGKDGPEGPRGSQGLVGPASTVPGPPGVGVPPAGLPELSRNYALNPSFALDRPFTAANGWSVVSATGTYEAGAGINGGRALQLAGSTAATARLEGFFTLPPGTYTLSIYYKVITLGTPVPSSGFGAVARMDTTASLASGTSSTTTTNSPLGEWIRHSSSFTVPADITGQVRVRYYTGAHVVQFSRAMVEAGSAAGPYWDGDTPGAEWVTPGLASPSVKRVIYPDDYGTLTGLATRLLRGTGMPEGVVAAPVGVEYVDEAVTNGAVKWIKASGTGATGWRLVYGDTGWRNVTPDPNNLTLTGATAPLCQIRRVGDRVSFRARLVPVAALVGTSRVRTWTVLNPIPTGFQARDYVGMGTVTLATTMAGGLHTAASLATLHAVTHAALTSGSLAANDSFLFSADWDTNQSWPTVLP